MNTHFVNSDRSSGGEAGQGGDGLRMGVGSVAPTVSGRPGRWWAKWTIPLLIVAVLLAHGMALNADFYMDDHAHILHRETGKIAKNMHYGYRWVTGLAWDGIYGVFGASSIAFHAFNLMLHMALTVSVFRVGSLLVKRVAPGGAADTAPVAALAGALIFATHPLLTEGVNYAQNASLQLVTLFTVGAVGFSLKFFDSGHPRWLMGVIGCLAASTFTKEVGLIYSGASAGLIWATVGGRSVSTLLRSHWGRLKWWLVAVLPILAYAIWYAARLVNHAVQYPMWSENFFTQGRLLWAYLGLMLWPTGLCADHLVPFSGIGWSDPVSLAATVAAGGMVALLGFGLWTQKGRTVCLLMLVGLIPLLMRFGYVNKELFVEYRAYPAMPWMALAAGCVFAAVFHRRPAAAGVALAALIGTYAVASSRRSAVWSDASQLALDNIRHYPNHIRSRTQLQKMELDAGNWDRVLQLRDESLRAFEALNTHNGLPGQRRKYEMSSAYRGYMCSEHFVALALTERDGSKRGLEHATRVLEWHRRLHPELFNPENNQHEIVEQIVEVHWLLSTHGAEYDRRRQSAAAPEGLQAAQ